MFYYSLPILLYEIRWVSIPELAVIAAIILAALWLAAPFEQAAECSQLPGTDELYMLHCWQGIQALWTVFWPFFLLLNGVIYGIDALTISGHLSVSTWDDVYFVLLTPVILWTLAVWRNSANTRYRIWAALARFMTLAVFFEYALKLLIRFDYPRVFFTCNESVLDYAACF